MTDAPRVIPNEELNARIEAAYGQHPVFREDYAGQSFATDLAAVLEVARYFYPSRIEVRWTMNDNEWQVWIGDGFANGQDLARVACWALLDNIL